MEGMARLACKKNQLSAYVIEKGDITAKRAIVSTIPGHRGGPRGGDPPLELKMVTPPLEKKVTLPYPTRFKATPKKNFGPSARNLLNLSKFM